MNGADLAKELGKKDIYRLFLQCPRFNAPTLSNEI